MASVLHEVTVIWTALIAGFMVSYCLVLGRYFNWLLTSDNTDGFSNYYSVFRTEQNVKFPYIIFVFFQFFLSVINFGINWRSLDEWGWISILCVPAFLSIHFLLSPFGKAEGLINSSLSISKETARVYLIWNLPLHITYGFIFVIGAVSIFRFKASL